jgi:hypothetical protein
LGACLLGAPQVAAAQGEKLEELIQESIRLRREGEDEQALNVLRQAEQLDPSSVRVLLHMATAAQAAGHWLEADEFIRRVFEHRDDPYFRRYEGDIESLHRNIESRIGRFQVVGAPAGAEVRLNGHSIGTLPMSGPHRVEAGVYQLEVVSSGHYTLRRGERIPGGVLTREVVSLDPEAPGAVQSGSVAYGDRPWWRERWLGWTLAGVGAASAVGAGVAFAVREQKAAEWNDDGRCVLPDGRTREQTCGGDFGAARVAERVGIASTVGALLFGSAAVLQLQFLARDDEGGSAPSEPPRQGASATCGPTWLGVTCAGAF